MTNFNWHSESEKQWNNRADFWNQQSQRMWDSGSRSTIIPFFSQYVSKGSKVLDAGCGDGYGSYKLSENGYDVIGIDLSTEMIEKANPRQYAGKLSFLQSDLSALPFDNGTFNAVMAINSLEWTERPLVAINELNRVTKNGGIGCIALLGPTAGPRQNSFRRLYNETVICNTMMPWEFKQLVQENGWDILDGKAVYKEGVRNETVDGLPEELKQSLSFMWIFIIKKS
ncbi:class I SAM-dependent methyltransferase [Ferdinandcohnia quinoae]|uniref:Class I SAM-dependent methyltransferase n=1 Tax=Fredinandcohnia quinoae TaxID=2918902 RepID=A0AAW5E4T5_9BACI|nr:class I SAM-dependent methyltransferase [Fredinandcohnia sp. SECRCQ15]MCH1627358.1 class I SAM-dependent methyltransferase [Fredinandcohnia sp. SECRCQ15]